MQGSPEGQKDAALDSLRGKGVQILTGAKVGILPPPPMLLALSTSMPCSVRVSSSVSLYFLEQFLKVAQGYAKVTQSCCWIARGVVCIT